MENVTVKKKYYDELNVFRGLIIIWVTIGHSTDLTQPVAAFFHTYAYSFHMCAFFLLSGILFASKLNRIQGIADMGRVLLDRFKRLMVPFLFYSAFTYGLKMVFKKYAFNDLPSNPVDILLGNSNANGGLWFLYSLFFFSVIAVLLCKVPRIVPLIVALGLKITQCFVTIPDAGSRQIFSLYYFSVFFFLGIFLAKYYDKLSVAVTRLFSKRKALFAAVTVLLTGVSFAALLAVGVQKSNEPENTYIQLLFAVCLIPLWYCLSVSVNTFPLLKKGAMVLGNYGMDIYLLGYFIQTSVRVVFGTILGAPYVVFTALMFFLGLLLPIPISKYIVRKVGIFRMLLLGDFSKKAKETRHVN